MQGIFYASAIFPIYFDMRTGRVYDTYTGKGSEEVNTCILDHQQVLSCIPDRPANGHKGTFGKLLLLCGSVGCTGAAALAAMGALRCGAGLVYLGVPKSIYAIEAIKLTEPVIFPLPDEDGKIAVQAAEKLPHLLRDKDAVLIGPGLGQSAGTEELVCQLLQQAAVPVILDADGINIVARHMDILRGRNAPTVLTPHDGEFLRLGYDPANDRVRSAEAFARDTGSILLLKGRGTVITDGRICYRNPTGNPGMATGGSGDVLAGMITALIGQGLDSLTAAACGAWLHGAAGDLAAAELGQMAMLPTDLLEFLPRLLK